MRRQWLEFYNLSDDTNVLEKRICSKHFFSENNESGLSKTLMKTGVPLVSQATVASALKTDYPKCVSSFEIDKPSTSAETRTLNDTYIEPRYVECR